MPLGKKTVLSVNIPSQLGLAIDLIYKMTNYHIDVHQLVDFISRNRPYNNIDYDAKASTDAILLSDIFVENIEHYQNTPMGIQLYDTLYQVIQAYYRFISDKGMYLSTQNNYILFTKETLYLDNSV